MRRQLQKWARLSPRVADAKLAGEGEGYTVRESGH
jgi:hypothetical protein